MTTKEKKFIISYLRATENEIAIDESVYSLCGISPIELAYCPRPTKIIGQLHGQKKLLRWILNAVGIAWRFGGARVFFLIELIRYYIYSKKCARANSCIDKYANRKEYIFAFSSRAADVIPPLLISEAAKCWITFPWAPIRRLPNGTLSRDVFELLNGTELFRACLLAIRASNKLQSRRSMSPWALQTYTAFRWFAVRIALDKLDGSRFVFSEHYDRWAVLVDNVVSVKRQELKSDIQYPELVLIQHGALGGLNLTDNGNQYGLAFELPNRLTSVTHAYLYDDFSRKVFEKDILSTYCLERGVTISYFKTMINLTKMNSDIDRKVLFVGYPICEALHVHVYEQLRRIYKADFFYKPHPTAPMGDLAKRQEWSVIQDRNIFPEVDFLISYPSTLVSEYETLGISAVLHPLNQNKEFSDDLLETLTLKLDALCCEKLLQE